VAGIFILIAVGDAWKKRLKDSVNYPVETVLNVKVTK
jgi:hypothetical protein